MPSGLAVHGSIFRRTLEHVYLTDAGGTPLVHLSRADIPDMDPDLVASMFTAVERFMDDSFHSMGIGDVRSIEMGERHHVTFGKGQSALLYVLYRGRESNHLERKVEAVVQEIERRYHDLLANWDGDVDRIAFLQQFLQERFGLETRPADSH